jgi:release factor glutamine methyltransferase
MTEHTITAALQMTEHTITAALQMTEHSIAAALQVAAGTLENHSETPRLDAELLLGKVLGVTRTTLIVRGAEQVPEVSRSAYAKLLAHRVRGTPVAYLTGSREFWSLNLTVTPDVLVPRPDTELLVELALTLCPEDASRRILDLGTGSGAVALAIAAERPCVHMTGVDISPAALGVARENGRRLGLQRVAWRLGSWFAGVSGERFDLIVANPPYVAAGDPALVKLAAEPRLALASGADGLDALAAIIERAVPHLMPGGWLLLEHGSTQAGQVAGMLERQGFGKIRSHADYSGNARVTLGHVHTPH